MSTSTVNFVIKIIAVLLAIFLWFNVITQKEYEHRFDLPVTEIDLPPNLGMMNNLPESLSVVVVAEGKKLMGGDWQKAGLRIKGARLKRGLNRLEINPESVVLVRGEEVELRDLPGIATIEIRLDAMDSILKPVASRLAVVPSKGYVVVHETVDPIKTMVTGPAALLRQIDSIYTEQKIIDDQKKSISLRLALEIPAGMSFTIAHDSAQVETRVEALKTRQFENIIVKSSGAWRPGSARMRPGQCIIDPDRVTLKVTGPESLIDGLKTQDIQVTIEIPTATFDGYLVPKINLPVGILLASVSPDSLRVVVNK